MSDNKDETTTNNIHPLKFNSAHFLNLSSIMTVTKVLNGEAQIILNEEVDASFKVHFHSATVPHLKEGDQVTVAATSNGIVILGKIRAANERPFPHFTQQQDGCVEIDVKYGIKIKTPKAQITITAEGEITIAGVRIDLTDIQRYQPTNKTH